LDRRHIVNITAVLETPKFNQRMLRTVASDWKVSTAYRYLSGAFQTVTTGVDYALNGSAVERPNQILGNPLCANPNPTCWINPAAFAATVPFGQFGNVGRSSVPGPSNFQTDLAITRLFKVREHMGFEIRGEAFNLTNSFRAGAPTTARNSPQFGQILSAGDPRIMQVAGKFTF